jgi:transposase
MIAGIDVGKFYLDVSIGGESAESFSNSNEGINALLSILQERQVSRTICEATGGYERDMTQSLRKVGIEAQVVHPNKVRAFAQASGVLAKTDKIDAQILFRFGEVFATAGQLPVDDKILKLRDLLRRRQQLIQMRGKEVNRLEKHTSGTSRVSCERHLAWLDEELAEMDRAYQTKLTDLELKAKADLYQSVRGIGILTAATLIAELPELGQYNSKSLTALVGLAPWSKDSGKQHGYRSIRGGRANIRKALYMAALSTIRREGQMRHFYLRLRHRGKPGKVAIVAVMRKMLLVINAIAHRGTPWTEIGPVSSI